MLAVDRVSVAFAGCIRLLSDWGAQAETSSVALRLSVWVSAFVFVCLGIR